MGDPDVIRSEKAKALVAAADELAKKLPEVAAFATALREFVAADAEVVRAAQVKESQASRY